MSGLGTVWPPPGPGSPDARCAEQRECLLIFGTVIESLGKPTVAVGATPSGQSRVDPKEGARCTGQLAVAIAVGGPVSLPPSGRRFLLPPTSLRRW